MSIVTTCLMGSDGEACQSGHAQAGKHVAVREGGDQHILWVNGCFTARLPTTPSPARHDLTRQRAKDGQGGHTARQAGVGAPLWQCLS